MKKTTFVAAVTATFTASIANAQATEPFVLGTIFLGSDATTTIGIENEDLTRTNPADLQDVFKTEPTISVGSSLAVSQKIYVGGVEENNLNVTIDGARQNNRIFHHTATTYIDPELLKAVRVDAGVAPADAGPGAIAGAIAFETKDVDDLLAPDAAFGGRVSTEYQSNGDTFTTSLGGYGRTGQFDYLLFGKLAEGDLLQDGDGDDITGSETSLTSGLAKLGYNGNDGSRIELTVENVEDDADRPLRADFAGLQGGDDTRTYTLERQNIVVSYTAAETSGLWNPSVTLAYNATDLYTGPMPGETDAYSGQTTSFTGKFQNEFSFSTGTVTAGIDFYDDVAELNGEETADYFADEKARNIGGFAQARFNLTDRSRVSGGMRYDFQEFEGVDGTTYENGGASANIAADYDVLDNLTISAGASSVWGGIALAESFLFDTAWVYPDEIDPVTSDNIYLAATAHAGAFDFNAKVFQTNIFNARTLYDPTTGLYNSGPGQTVDFESEGFEVGVKYNWANGFARIAYADIDSTIDGVSVDSYAGRYLSTPLGKNLILETGHDFVQYNVSVGADAQIIFDQEESTTVTLDGYTVVNAFVQYQPAAIQGLTVRGEVNNLEDETYVDRASYGQEFASVTPLAEPGRSVGLRLTYEF